jgi:adenosylmethionine-8-amino-7-oxononanoate aminotransferase
MKASSLACASDRLPQVGDLRQWGLMVGIELVRDRQRRMPFDPSEKIGARVVAEARRRGVILRPLGSVIILMPPLSVSVAELETLVRVTAESIEAATTVG